MVSPADYEAWYHTPRGAWIAQREFALLSRLLPPVSDATLLNVGTGTGHFARRFAAMGLEVMGLDPDPIALNYARSQRGGVAYLEGNALNLPFADNSFDYCAAITSLCFISEPMHAVQEMWRVARRGIVLGLLQRHSLLDRQKAGHGAYTGARWDDMAAVRAWLLPATHMRYGYAIFLPSGGSIARLTSTSCHTPSHLAAFWQ